MPFGPTRRWSKGSGHCSPPRLRYRPIHKRSRRPWRTAVLDERQKGDRIVLLKITPHRPGKYPTAEGEKSMTQLRNQLEEAQSNGVGVGHFNISDLTLLKAVNEAAQELKVPVIVGASEGERAFLGVAQIAALVRSLREEQSIPIFLNADHTHSLESAMAAAKAGFDSIVYDLSALPFAENVKQTRQAVEALKSVNPKILVEGEIGNIGTGSEIHDSVPDHSKD